MYLITYRSCRESKDRETYNNKETAEKRFEQLKNCKAVDELEMREG